MCTLHTAMKPQSRTVEHVQSDVGPCAVRCRPRPLYALNDSRCKVTLYSQAVSHNQPIRFNAVAASVRQVSLQAQSLLTSWTDNVCI